jgi:hypothetical protein
LESLFKLRDPRNRGLAHFATACGKFHQLYDSFVNHRCETFFIANAVELDVQGLLPIHYAACFGSIDEIQFLSNFEPGYVAVTEDDNHFSVLDLAILSANFTLAKWLLLETGVRWVDLSSAAFLWSEPHLKRSWIYSRSKDSARSSIGIVAQLSCVLFALVI